MEAAEKGRDGVGTRQAWAGAEVEGEVDARWQRQSESVPGQGRQGGHAAPSPGPQLRLCASVCVCGMGWDEQVGEAEEAKC